MANNTEHFLKMSGTVPPGKRKELEQTFRFVSNQLTPVCLQCSLSADIFITDMYHFYSLWPTAEALGNFCKSQEFQVLEGAYKTLGSLEKNTTGELQDIKSFQIYDKDV